MLHTSLVAAMAVGALGHAPKASLLDLMPHDAAMVMELGDLQSLLATPMDERGDWMRFFTDDRTQMLLDVAMEEEAEVSSIGLLGELAAAVQGGAVAIVDLEEGPFIAALQVTDGFEDALIAFGQNIESPLAEGELLGMRALVDEEGSFAVVEAKGATLMIMTAGGDAESELGALLEPEDTEQDEAPWWTGIGGGLDASIFQVFFDFGALPDDGDPEMEIAKEVIKYLHMDINAGDGREGGVSFSIEFHENEIVDAFMAAGGGEADHDLMLMAPEGAQTIQCGNMDFGATIDALITLVDAIEPEAGAQDAYEQGLEAGSTFLGIDIQSEIIGNFSGDVFGFQWEQDLEGILAEDPDAMLDSMPVLGLGINDPEPFIELLEIIEPFAAELGGEVTDDDTTTTFTVEPEPGFLIQAVVSPKFLYIGADPGRIADTVGREGTVKADGAVDKATLQLAKETMTGPGVALWDISVVAEIFALLMQEDDTTDVPDELFEMLDAFSEHVTGVGMNDFQLGSNVLTLRMMTR